jgi:hypothetical protein
VEAPSAVGPVLASIFASPISWVILAGVCLGAAIASATARTARRRNPERAHARKWVAACLLACAAVVLGLLAVFVPGPARMLDVRLAWAAGVAAVVSFATLRFKKALGIPVLVLLILAGSCLGLFLRSVRAFTGETTIATVRVLALTDTGMRLELVPRDADPVLLTMQGVYFAPIVKVVIFDDLLVFFGARSLYRFEGMTSFDASLRQLTDPYRFPKPSGISEILWAFFEKNEQRIPGLKSAQIDFIGKRAREFASYEIRVQNDGGVQVVPVGASTGG